MPVSITDAAAALGFRSRSTLYRLLDQGLLKDWEEGFTLWDRTFNTLAPAAVSVSTLRNYDFHYTHKNWETTLIWIKQ
jgi:hypothetical protein